MHLPSFAGNKRLVLDWQARLKIAIGTARGLRYLHEDCRVGCIIHGKLWPSNILLTHDFEPLVHSIKVLEAYHSLIQFEYKLYMP